MCKAARLASATVWLFLFVQAARADTSNGKFARMSSLEIPFSESDLGVMRLTAGDLVIRHVARTLSLERDGNQIAKLDLPSAGSCTEPWIRSVFLDEKTHTLLVELAYRERGRCAPPAPAWRIVRFP